jgi:hypothetical protein
MCFSKDDAGLNSFNSLQKFSLQFLQFNKKTLLVTDFLVDAMDYAMSGF